MRKIIKRETPQNLASWIRNNPNGRYSDLNSDIRQIIKTHCCNEQYNLCGYCCCRIIPTSTSCHNEHVIPQDRSPQISTDFNNIIASCNNIDRCGKSHGSRHIPLTPFMDECEIEFEYRLNGTIRGKTDRATETINILNLGDSLQNNRLIVETRKQLVEALIYSHGETPDQVELLDDELLIILSEEISTPSEGELEPFSPVLSCILKNWLSNQ